MTPLVCAYEDRHTHVPGVQLLIASLLRHQPGWAIRLRFPAAPPALRAWCATKPEVQLLDAPIEGAGSYNIKPHVLLDGLDTGANTCLWLDTDILVNGSLDHLAAPSAETLISTLDPWAYEQGSNRRAGAFGLSPGEPLMGPVNSAVVRVGQAHRAMLSAWIDLLRQPEYKRQQSLPVDDRHRLMLGDQDALSALLGAREWQPTCPLVLLRHPVDVLHHHGAGAFSYQQRRAMGSAAGLPSLLHAMGSTKPWMIPSHVSIWRSPRQYYERAYLETSPYVVKARGYREVLTTSPIPWLESQTLPARLSLWWAEGDPVTAGTFQALLHNLRRP